ncbi:MULTISPECIES: hypothetical protein [unclassified Wolbachia]|uniref:hypothetical protein n=1 Tax=unclassified Wolbachia TaxID=2640676 RepID=UPI0005A0C850|nr:MULTISPECIES: hypothetical protein [unclassified Wolbachia]
MTVIRLAVILVWNPGKRMVSSHCPDTGIQESLLVNKQTSIESGYNVFDEIIWKTGFQCQALE